MTDFIIAMVLTGIAIGFFCGFEYRRRNEKRKEKAIKEAYERGKLAIPKSEDLLKEFNKIIEQVRQEERQRVLKILLKYKKAISGYSEKHKEERRVYHSIIREIRCKAGMRK